MPEQTARPTQDHILYEISQTLQRLAPPIPKRQALLADTPTYIWQNYDGALLHPIYDMPYLELEQLKGLDLQKEILWQNTDAFAAGLRANNALLWGARGMGKSSLVKSIVMRINHNRSTGNTDHFPLLLIELPTQTLETLGTLIEYLRSLPNRCIVFCDDLSFNHDDARYRMLKSCLDGGLRGWPSNVLIYATSNRRHLMARSMQENEEQAEEILPGETTEEKISLSDRFGLWLGFHPCDQELFDEIILSAAQREGLTIDRDTLLRRAHTWSRTRGGISGRVAQQFLTALRIELLKDS